MSILDPNYAEEVDKQNVPISIELLHQEGWEFSMLDHFDYQEWEYPDISKWPIHGSDPWNPYWLVNKDVRLDKIKMIWDYSHVLEQYKTIKWDNKQWSITDQPRKVMFEIDERHYYARTWQELIELTNARLLDYQKDQILRKFNLR